MKQPAPHVPKLEPLRRGVEPARTVPVPRPAPAQPPLKDK
jgi:hypothetical protein